MGGDLRRLIRMAILKMPFGFNVRIRLFGDMIC